MESEGRRPRGEASFERLREETRAGARERERTGGCLRAIVKRLGGSFVGARRPAADKMSTNSIVICTGMEETVIIQEKNRARHATYLYLLLRKKRCLLFLLFSTLDRFAPILELCDLDSSSRFGSIGERSGPKVRNSCNSPWSWICGSPR